MNRNRLVLSVLVGLFAVTWLIVYVSASASARSAGREVDAATAPPVASVVQGIGYVEPVDDVRNLAFKGGGLVGACLVDVGARVRAGDVLMTLDGTAERRALAVAEQELELAKAERDDILASVNPFEIQVAKHRLEAVRERLDRAERDYHRSNQLFKNSTISSAQHDGDKSTYFETLAEVRRAESELQHLENYVTPQRREAAERRVKLATARKELADQVIADLRLCAPTDGVVLEILKREGEAVSALMHEPVIVFADIARLRVRAEIDERFVHHLRVGHRATIFGKSSDRASCQGSVARIKDLMGKRTVFSRSSTERKDLDVVQVLVDLEPEFTAPAGLRVDVAIQIDEEGTRE